MNQKSRWYRLLCLMLATLLLLSACSSPAPAPKEEEPQPEENKPVDSLPYTPPDYSDHTSPIESYYVTRLTDDAEIPSGLPSLAVELPARMFQQVFQGLTYDKYMGYDVRHMDISDADLSAVEDYNDLSFSTSTVWPDELPEGFDPEAILELGKNPGLGIRDIHAQGITGKGVSIAIIDQALYTGHQEYKDNLMTSESIHGTMSASMHGSAVCSIAAGREVGVAPDAKIYYISTYTGHNDENGGDDNDFSILADCIRRVVAINQKLPAQEKIRVISVSQGYRPTDLGYEELMAAIEEADQAGIFVLTVSAELFYRGFPFVGMSRDYMADPDDVNSYGPADLLSVGQSSGNYLVPMGSRTYASFTGEDQYEIDHQGGVSWAVPWLAGLYALCCQVKPEITPQEFIDTVKATSTTVDFGHVVNPAAIMDALQQ